MPSQGRENSESYLILKRSLHRRIDFQTKSFHFECIGRSGQSEFQNSLKIKYIFIKYEPTFLMTTKNRP